MEEEFPIAELPKKLLEETTKIKDLQEEFSKSLDDYEEKLQNNLRNVAILSGALAVGAVVLLGSNSLINQELVIFGIVLLLLNTMISMGYLVHVSSKAIYEYEIGISVLEPVLAYYRSYQEAINKRDEKILKEFPVMPENKIHFLEKSVGFNKNIFHAVELIIFTTFSAGVLLIVLGLSVNIICTTFQLCLI